MTKKRKAPRTFEQPQISKATKYDVEERFNDSEDEFYAGRDKILLDEGADVKRRRRLAEQEKDLQASDEEILGYEEDLVSDEDEGIEDEDDTTEQLGPRQKFRRKDKEESDEEDSDEEHWGTSRADYYGDDVVETEEQAKEEENEAKRLHLKQLRNMTAADFGFDELQWTSEQNDSRKIRHVVERLPEAQIPENASVDQKHDILLSRYPEFLPLRDESTLR